MMHNLMVKLIQILVRYTQRLLSSKVVNSVFKGHFVLRYAHSPWSDDSPIYHTVYCTHTHNAQCTYSPFVKVGMFS